MYPTSAIPARLLTVAEAAALARVTRRTLERRIASGELPVLRVGSRVRITPRAFARFLCSNGTDEAENGIEAIEAYLETVA